MSMSQSDSVLDSYSRCLTDYLSSRSEASLYRASLLGQTCVEGGLGPEEIIAVHAEALEQAIGGLTPRQIASAGVDGLQFLLEVMIAYGVQYQRYLELRLLEHQRETEEAQRVARMQADVMATISHELRSPVTVVRGNLDLAVRSLAQQQPEKVPLLLESARQALTRLSRMTADLYEASRGETPELILSRQDLAVIASQAHTWAVTPATEKGVELIFVPGGGPLLVTGDGDALLTVLGNLISNAIRYTPAGGQVAIQTGGDAEHVWVQVADTGIGMTEEAQAHIFEKFYRSPEARQVDAHGLGLGLALAHQLVLAHGGSLTVRSAPGAGSTFRMTLPRHSTPVRSRHEEQARHDGPSSS